ncbi:MAG: flagellar basal body rod protein FlgC [candidate division Zixibacteria bacterium]|jgi:flagellar basal-body rod protein FlgC|nr:flagellar basal body rod protein FlgC [candidate division Zixibacteria bacterium]
MIMSDMFASLKISGSGLSVNRRKMNVTAENIANVETTRTRGGGPYRKKTLHISGRPEAVDFNTVLRKHTLSLNRSHNNHFNTRKVNYVDGLEITLPESREALDPESKVKMVYDPAHPDANEDGWVAMPDINILMEMVNMMTAARSFEANATALEATKNIYSAALDI